MKATFFQLALAAFLALVAPSMVSATSSSRQRCFIEPFPQMLASQIQNHRTCGLNNPHVIDVVCEPVRGLVPDAIWLDWQLKQFESEVEAETTEQDSSFETSTTAGTLSARSMEPFRNTDYLPQAAAALALAFTSSKL